MNEKLLDYKEFQNKLNLSDDKISRLLYDLYVYELTQDEKEEDNKEDKKQ